MAKSSKLFIFVIFFLFLCCGCKADHYTLSIYEQEPVKITLQDQKVKEFDQFMTTIMDHSEKANINKDNLPKSNP